MILEIENLMKTLKRREFCVGGAAVTLSQAVPFGAFAKDQSNLRAVELFAGIGGFRLACDSLGIHTIWANDINENAVKVYRDQFGDNEVVCGDINQLIDKIPDHDILTGGFPCQPFSRAGKKLGIEDYRGTLFESIVKILDLKRPQYFILENVNSLLFMENGKNFRTILDALDELGYKIEWRVFNAAGFGVPQHRLRVVIAGSRNAAHKTSYFLTEAEAKTMGARQGEIVAQHDLWTEMLNTKGKSKQWGMSKSGKVVQFDFDPPRSIISEKTVNDILQNDVGQEFDFTEDTLNRIEKSVFVNKFYNGVRILYNQGGGARMGYTIFGTDGLSPTLTASTSRHYERYGINGRYRRLTNVEYARLQGFPDDHCRAVSVYEQYRLYGNAVPPPMVRFAIDRVVGERTVSFASTELPLFN